ncbi:HAD family hydrolase [Roseibium sp. M-1]
MKRPDIRGVLFDKDGTLLHFEETWGRNNRTAALMAADGDSDLAQSLLVAAGVDPETGRTRSGSVLAAGNSSEIADLWAAIGSPLPRDQLVRELDVIFGTSMQSASAIEGTAMLLEHLKASGLKLGVASSDSETAIRVFLETTGLAHHFDFVTGYDTGHGHKPEPGMLDAFCRACGLPSGSVAVVGDNPQDMIMARRGQAGLAVGVLTGTGSEEELRMLADVVLADITLLAALLGRAAVEA